MLYRQDEINNWAAAKGIHANSTAEKQFTKLFEEFAELYGAVHNNNVPEIKDAIGDCYVVLTNIAWFWGLQEAEPLDELAQVHPQDVNPTDCLRGILGGFADLRWADLLFRVREYQYAMASFQEVRSHYGFSFEECVDQAVDTILKRTGKMVDGVFVKDA